MSVRLTILLLVLLVVIGGLVGVTQVIRSGDDDGSDSTAGLKERLYRVSSEQLASFTVNMDDEAITFVHEGDEWFIQDNEGGENAPVDPVRWGGIPLLVSGPSADKNLSDGDDEIGDPASFGLEPPRSKLNLTPFRGETIELLIGDPTPTEDGYYTKLADASTIYVTNSTWVEVVERLLTEPPFIPEDDKLYLYNLGNDLLVSVTVRKDGDEITLVQLGGLWYIEDPAGGENALVDPSYGFGLPIILTAPEVEVIPPESDEGPGSYGLEPPRIRVEVTTARGRTVEVHVGDKTPSGDRHYLREAGEDTVFVIIYQWVQLFEQILTDPPYAAGAPP